MSSLQTGQVLEGRYEVEAVIARGGMSTVYRCLDHRLGRRVAAKVMSEPYVHDPVFRQRFRREARSMAQLAHPCLVGVYDFNSEGEHVFLIMELITGGTVRELLAERGPMPASMAATVMRSILTGLAVAHDAHLVHRDIKPDNVLIHGNHQVKLSDFGLVRAASVAQANPNHILGTVSYLSPEQVDGQEITPASDVYSAGVLLFELLTGQVPFSGATALDHAYARLQGDVPAPSSINPQVPRLFDELVSTACAKNPAERFEDAGEFLAALDDVARELGLPESRVPIPHNAAAHRASELLLNPQAPATEMFTTAIPRAQEDPATTVIPAAADETSIIGGPPQFPAPATAFLDQPKPPATPPAPTPAAGAPAHPETAFLAPETTAMPAATPAAAPANPATAMYPAAQAAAPAPVIGQDAAPAPAQRPQVSNNSKAAFIIWLIIVLAITAAVAVGGWWFGSGRYGEIPQVVGMEQTAASQQLTDAGFGTATSGVYDDAIPINHVVSTDPAQGGRQVKGDDVTLFVSLGQPTVPELTAAFEDEAAQRTFTLIEGPAVYSDTVDAGQVAQVSPAPGTVLPVGSPLTVARSLGPAPVNVPSVAGLSAEEAWQALSDLGLEPTVQYGFSDRADNDIAYATSPEAGTQVPKGSSVTVQVSTASTVPDVAGLTEDQARTLLAERGIRVSGVERATSDTATGDTPDTVAESTPAAGTRIDASQTAVTLVLVNRVAIPRVMGMTLSEARQTLTDAGFKVTVTGSTDPEAFVYWQNPTVQTSAAYGSEIILRTVS